MVYQEFNVELSGMPTHIEKFLLIFIEFRKDKIREIIKDDTIEGVIEIMDKLKLDMKIPTYDGEAKKN